MDKVTYALCKKLIASSSTGIKNITYNELTDELVFTMADGSKISLVIRIKEDCASFKFVDSLPPIEEAEENIVYLILDASNIMTQYMFKNNEYILIARAGIAKATSSTVGLVKPDNETIVVDDGTISISNEYLENTIKNSIKDNVTPISKSSIESLFN